MANDASKIFGVHGMSFKSAWRTYLSLAYTGMCISCRANDLLWRRRRRVFFNHLAFLQRRSEYGNTPLAQVIVYKYLLSSGDLRLQAQFQ